MTIIHTHVINPLYFLIIKLYKVILYLYCTHKYLHISLFTQITLCGVIKPSDIHLPFILGLRPMPRSKIVCEKDSGNHGDLENRAEDNFILDQQKSRQKKSDLPTKTIFQSTPRKKIDTASKHTRAWQQSNSRKNCCLHIKCFTTNTLAALMWK